MQYLFLNTIIMNWSTGSQLSKTVRDSLSLRTIHTTFTCTSSVSIKPPRVSSTGSWTRLRSHRIMRPSDCLLYKLHCSPSWRPLFPYVPRSIWSCSGQHRFQKKFCYWAGQNFWRQWMLREKSVRRQKAPSRPLPTYSLIYQQAVPYGLAKLKATSQVTVCSSPRKPVPH